jgi:hypothetical protein
MRYFGFFDAELTASGPDAGVDVRSSEAVAQVKAHMVPIGRPDLQRLHGIAVSEKKIAVFFSLMHYTAQAIAWGNSVGMALFRFNHAGEPEPVNSAAEALSAGSMRGGAGRDAAMRAQQQRLGARDRSASRTDVMKKLVQAVCWLAVTAGAFWFLYTLWHIARDSKRDAANVESSSSSERAFEAAHTRRFEIAVRGGSYVITLTVKPPVDPASRRPICAPSKESPGEIDVPFVMTGEGTTGTTLQADYAVTQDGGSPSVAVNISPNSVECQNHEYLTESVPSEDGEVSRVLAAGPDPTLTISLAQLVPGEGRPVPLDPIVVPLFEGPIPR